MRIQRTIPLLAILITAITAIPISVSANQSNDSKQIINEETVEIDGVPVTFTLYNDNGVYSETAKINENSLKRSSKIDRKAILDKAIQVADQRAEKLYSSLDSNNEPIFDSLSNSKSIYMWTEEKTNSAYGTGAGENRNTYAGHWSTVDYTVVDTAANMKAYDGASRVLYNGSRTLDRMMVTETLTKKQVSFGLSISWPPGFSISSSNSSAFLSTTWDGDYGFCTQYRNNFSASAVLNPGTFVTVKTVGQVVSNNESYTASVESKW